MPTFAIPIGRKGVNKENPGAIAQLVEQRTENPCVPGSIPGGTTKTSVEAILLRFFRFTTLPDMHGNHTAVKFVDSRVS